VIFRFDLWSKPGEMPAAVTRRARKVVASLLGSWRSRGLLTGPYRETSKPHREIVGDPVAERVSKEKTVRVKDRNGHGWIDRSHGGDLEYDSDESTKAYIQLNANVDTLNNRIPILKRLLERAMGERERRTTPTQRTLEPPGVDVGRP
jgi:hypothetical protein